jgi:hypothetical protein
LGKDEYPQITRYWQLCKYDYVICDYYETDERLAHLLTGLIYRLDFLIMILDIVLISINIFV